MEHDSRHTQNLAYYCLHCPQMNSTCKLLALLLQCERVGSHLVKDDWLARG